MFFKRKAVILQEQQAPEPLTTQTVIARDVIIEGTVTATKDLHIYGTVYGAVHAQAIVLETQGYIQGDITGDRIAIRGRVVGTIHGRDVQIFDGAEIEGDIYNDTITIEGGANLFGRISRTNELPQQQQRPAAKAAEFFAIPPLNYGQNNDYERDMNAYRPISVVKPLKTGSSW